YTQFENPTRSFTEIKAVDENWEGRRIMENFALFTEAQYQIDLRENEAVGYQPDSHENVSAININFSLAGEIPETGYSEYLLNGFCTDKPYDMTVTDARTGEIIQKQQVSMSIEMPDMIDFMDLDWDGYSDMKIELPTHSSGERATINAYSKKSYMLWNPEKNCFEQKTEKEIAEIIRQNQAQDAGLTEYVVVSGDTLWGISRRFYKTGTLYTEIEKENEEILSYYEYLMPGTRLKIPNILLQEQESPLFCLYCSNYAY
ncbi:MAG: LysM peptidoglycan-binding domain-containing protein, partial [Lachnospiraceae bacterium]|nr:LysM peptidoglycan-binding domain-containing protein [Lachnospiraceae bacterium]